MWWNNRVEEFCQDIGAFADTIVARDLRRPEAVLAEHDYSATDFIVG